jgi:uncharacterized protein (DUF697 family)/tellurite resistance protein
MTEPTLTEQERKSILTVCMMAAFADGSHDRERDEIRRIAEGLASESGADLSSMYQDVLLRRVSVAEAVGGLESQAARQLAYEMAVCVCDADGLQSPEERAFIGDLGMSLGLDAGVRKEYSERAEAIAAAPMTAGATTGPVAATSSLDQAATDKMILDASILNGALELLPESLSTMAIIPLQMRLVYRIGKAHGYELDQGHIKDFLATAGVGLTSQYLEQAGRKLLGGLLGAIGGGLLRGVGRQAVSSGMSFASTYALGHVAQRYYAGGRTFSTGMLRDAFQQVLGQAKGMQARYLPQMQEQARTLNPARIIELVRNG